MLAMLVPPLCPLCSGLTADGGICADCWHGLSLITETACQRCALPFPHGGGSAICGNCLAHPPGFDRGVAALAYNDTARQLILAFKHGDRLDIAPVLARLMLPASRGLLEQADIIIPLPLHPKRFLKRRFNQSAELGRHLTALAGLPQDRLQHGLLLRRRNTPSQARMTRLQRQRNVAGAFTLAAGAKAVIAGKSILLIDDVLTTGASLSAAATCLKRAGAETVAVSVAARVC